MLLVCECCGREKIDILPRLLQAGGTVGEHGDDPPRSVPRYMICPGCVEEMRTADSPASKWRATKLSA